MMSASPLLVRNLSAGYNNDEVLKDITFHLDTGQMLALVGGNGSGKTTLINCITGIISNFKGEICARGQNIGNLSRKKLARILAAAPQNAIRPAGQSVLGMTLLGRYPWLNWFGLFDSEDRAYAISALEITGIDNLAQRDTKTLSGGEWQRCVLARALCQIGGEDSPLLVLDEIAAGLDPGRALEIFSLLNRLCKKGAAIMASIHDCNLAAIFASHILALKQGKQLFFGPVEEVFTEENLSELYDMPVGIFAHPDLGIPQMYPRFFSPGLLPCADSDNFSGGAN